MASNKIIKKLPSYTYDKGYYVIDGSKGNVTQTLRSVRVLGLHKEKNSVTTRRVFLIN
jgi:hypothetical protein